MIAQKLLTSFFIKLVFDYFPIFFRFVINHKHCFDEGIKGGPLMAGHGLVVIKLEYSLKLKIKRLVRKQPIIALYFEFEN